MPIKIRNGTLDKPSFAASPTANAISTSARPTSRIAFSIHSPGLSFDQQTLEGINRGPVAGGYKRRAFAEHRTGFRVGMLRLVGFDNRDYGGAGACANLKI